MTVFRNRKVANIVSILLVAIFAFAFYLTYTNSVAKADRKTTFHTHPPDPTWVDYKLGIVRWHAPVTANCAMAEGNHPCSCSGSCNC